MSKLSARQEELQQRRLEQKERWARKRRLRLAMNQLELALESWPKTDYYRPPLLMIVQSLRLFIEEVSIKDLQL